MTTTMTHMYDVYDETDFLKFSQVQTTCLDDVFAESYFDRVTHDARMINDLPNADWIQFQQATPRRRLKPALAPRPPPPKVPLAQPPQPSAFELLQDAATAGGAFDGENEDSIDALYRQMVPMDCGDDADDAFAGCTFGGNDAILTSAYALAPDTWQGKEGYVCNNDDVTPMHTFNNALHIVDMGTYQFESITHWQARSDLWIPANWHSIVTRDDMVLTLRTTEEPIDDAVGASAAGGTYGGGTFGGVECVVAYHLYVCHAHDMDTPIYDQRAKGPNALTKLVKGAFNACIDAFPSLNTRNGGTWSRNGVKSAYKLFGLRSLPATQECKRQEQRHIQQRRAQDLKRVQDDDLNDRLLKRMGWCPRDAPTHLYGLQHE